MRAPDAVVDALRARGELWEAGPGLVGLRGAALARLGEVDAACEALARAAGAEPWRVPAGLALRTLERARYFASFPHWLTTASHLRDDAGALERIASAASPIDALPQATSSPGAALPPAVCYHVYAALADRRLDATAAVTAQCTCWRHEGDRHAPLARGWAFTMREVVVVGEAVACAAARERLAEAALALARSMGVEARWVLAEDPFFAPTARGQALLQRVKGLKRELVVDLPGAPPLAIASVNDHERYFGDAFGILAGDGDVASSSCVAFGLERWLLALLCADAACPAPTSRARLRPTIHVGEIA